MHKHIRSSPVSVFHVQSIGETVTFAPENLAYAWKKIHRMYYSGTILTSPDAIPFEHTILSGFNDIDLVMKRNISCTKNLYDYTPNPKEHQLCKANKTLKWRRMAVQLDLKGRSFIINFHFYFVISECYSGCNDTMQGGKNNNYIYWNNKRIHFGCRVHIFGFIVNPKWGAVSDTSLWFLDVWNCQ